MITEENIRMQCGGMDALIQPHPVEPERLEKDLIIEKLNTFISRYEDTSLYINDEKHHDVVKQFIRVRKEFDSTRFFVLVVGPVKSGKSSFVNILARNTVSPTDVTECTAIPTIIGKAEDTHRNKIVRYIPNAQNLDRGDVFDDVIDVLRGIAHPSIFDGQIELKEDESSDENLKRFLTVSSSVNAPVEAMPLLATIGIEETPFINDEIMVIDMPGLDGGEVNWDNNPLYARMVKRADFIFFVQSSTTTINESSVGFLNWLLENRDTNVPLRLIHNEHDSLYFLKEEIRRAKIERQVEAAKYFILDNISNQHGLDFNNYVLNLAKIGKSLMAPQEICVDFKGKLEEERAGYETREKEIVDELKVKRLQYKEKNCINRSNSCIANAQKVYKLISEDIENKMIEIDKSISDYNGFENRIMERYVSFAQLKEDFEKKMQSECIREKYVQKIDNETKGYIDENVIKQCTGEELKSHIDSLAEKYTNIDLLGRDSEVYKLLCRELSSTIKEEFKDITEKISESLDVSNDDINQCVKVEFPVNLKFHSRYGDITNRYRLGGIPIPLVERRYDLNNCIELLTGTTKDEEEVPGFSSHCKGKLDYLLENYKDKVFSSFPNVLAIWKESLWKLLEDRVNDKIHLLENEKLKLKNQFELMEEMINSLIL